MNMYMNIHLIIQWLYTYSNSTYRNTFSFQSKNGMYKYIREVTNGVVIWIYDSKNIKKSLNISFLIAYF